MTKLRTHLIALAGVALVAFAGVESPHYGTATFLVALIGVATVGALFLQIRGRLNPTIVDGQVVRPSQNLVNTKRILIAFMALGIAAYVGGGGTFSSFNAETSNPGSGISSGTLTLTDQVNSSAQVCATINAYTHDNDNSQPYNVGTAPLGCEAALALTNLAPGSYDGLTGASKLTLANTGSLDASKFYLYGSYVNGVLSTALTSGGTPSTISVASLEGPVTTGDTIKLSYGTHAETCVAGASTAASFATATITLSSCDDGTVSHANIYNFAYLIGTRVLDSSTDTSPTNTDCWDSQTTTSPVSGASKGTDLNFNPTTGNPMCTTALFWVQEQTNGKNYCWYGLGSQGGAQLHTGSTSAYNGSVSSDHVEDTLGHGEQQRWLFALHRERCDNLIVVLSSAERERQKRRHPAGHGQDRECVGALHRFLERRRRRLDRRDVGYRQQLHQSRQQHVVHDWEHLCHRRDHGFVGRERQRDLEQRYDRHHLELRHGSCADR
jgi:hypothetical protein